MSYHQAKKLLERYKANNCTDEEKRLVEKWLFQLHNEKVELTDDEFNQIEQEIWRKLPRQPARETINWRYVTIAASIAVFLCIGLYFFLNSWSKQESGTTQNFTDDVLPGSNTATLTLGDGKKIKLNTATQGRLAVQGGVHVIKDSAGEVRYQTIEGKDTQVLQNTLTTERKEQYHIILPDGTGVWLNAASSITFPTVFAGKFRDVAVNGEVYFEVAHDITKPFRVMSGRQTVEVLGTHFNINAYLDEPVTKTTLLEGKIKISNAEFSKIIIPGEQAVARGNRLSVNLVSLEEVTAWKDGYFRFDKESIPVIMRKLARWYDIDVQIEGKVSDDEFSGTISRSKKLSEVLKALEYYKTVHFKIEGRRVTVLK